MVIAIKKRIKLILFFIAFMIIAPIVLLYAHGDILGTGWTLLPTGGIFINSAPSGSSIFLNNKPKETTSFFSKSVVIKSLRSGNYEISVTKDGYNSWSKKISVLNNFVSDANVFMLQEKVEIRDIEKYLASSTKKNPEYVDIAAVFSKVATTTKNISTSTIDFKSNLGTKHSPIMNGKIGLWREGYKIYAQWFGREEIAPRYFCDMENCTKMIEVIDLGDFPMRFNFLSEYPGVVVIALNEKIFAIQIENNPEKKEQIIFSGINPDFRISNGSLYIKDGIHFSEVIL